MKPPQMMEIKKLKHNEVSAFRDLLEIFKNVFESEEEISDQEHLGKLLSHPDFMVFVIMQNKQVLGGLTLYILPRYYGTKPMAYIYDVGIAPEFQGQGLGKDLMAEVCKYCAENGFEEAYVEAESDDIEAVHFYRKTKYSYEMNAIHFTYAFNQ